MTRAITHKHLKRQFDIFEDKKEIDELLAELRFSTLLLPESRDSDDFGFLTLHSEGKIYVPVFTDVHEFNKCNLEEDFTPMPYDFNFYLELLYDKVDGIIIDMEGDRFPLVRELCQIMETNYIFDYDPNVFTMKEIKGIKDAVDNVELEEFLKDESSFWDLETLWDLLLKSDLFMVALSEEDISHQAENGVISLHLIGDLPTATVAKGTESYALIYSSESEVKPKSSPMHPYLQLVNLSELVNRVLMDDLDGLILNENSQNITISRKFLLDFMKDFISPCIDKYDNYAFPLDF